MSADVEAAFLQGDKMERPTGDIYLTAPPEGWPGVALGLLVKITKAIFGFASSPRLWWTKFAAKALELRETEEVGPCKGCKGADRRAKIAELFSKLSRSDNSALSQ